MPIVKNKLTKKDEEKIKEILARLAQSVGDFNEAGIDDTDFTDEMFEKAIAEGKVYTSWQYVVEAKNKRNKKAITIRLNQDVLDFIKNKQGKGYQTLINEVLTEWAKHHGMQS